MSFVPRPPALSLLAACLLLGQATFAADTNGPPPPGGAHQPPPEAVAACKGRTAGTAASFTDRGGRTVSGTCALQGDVLAVRPAGGPGGGPGGAASAPK